MCEQFIYLRVLQFLEHPQLVERLGIQQLVPLEHFRGPDIPLGEDRDSMRRVVLTDHRLNQPLDLIALLEPGGTVAEIRRGFLLPLLR